ncbi:YhgE/Pip domain-containing protein [Nocardioides sp. GXZ039]|uniref:YhgE/Pip domain-containing protein n=1 Tax=Nocardioides sp. GXZ039 TaxID=3136018 RepID=UPI0030F44A76
MRAFHLGWTELRRITASPFARIVVLALVAVPTIYAGLYLYANHDPYGALDRVPAAIVVEDAGAEQDDGKPLDAGREVADELLDSGDFGWHEVDRAEAERGVEDGTYDFALVIPRDFSKALSSNGGADPEQARLRMVTNDANSYLSTTIANTVVGKVREAISERVSQQATETFLLGISDVRHGLIEGADGAAQLRKGARKAHDGAARLVDGAGQLVDGAGQLEDGAGRLHDGAGELADGATTLAQGLGKLADNTADLPGQTRKLAEGARKVAQGDRKLADIGDEAVSAVHAIDTAYGQERRNLVAAMNDQGLSPAQQRRILAIYDRIGNRIDRADDRATTLGGRLDQLADGAEAVADGNRRLADGMVALNNGVQDARDGAGRLRDGASRLESGASDLQDGAGELTDGAGRLKKGAATLRDGLGDLRDGAEKLRSSLADGADQLPDNTKETQQHIAKTIADPVDVKDTSSASADSYGAGLAPFFISLATWIGGYVLFLLVRPLSNRALAANQRPWRIALGGWLPPALLGMVQVTLMLAVVSFAVGIAPGDFLATWAFLLLVVSCFVALIHALCAWLGSAGQFVALVVMVLQLVTAGGTFPWQTIPEALFPVHHVMPMSYAVDGLRQLMYGGSSDRLWQDVGVLAIWLVAGLLASTLAAVRARVWTPDRVRPQFTLG